MDRPSNRMIRELIVITVEVKLGKLSSNKTQTVIVQLSFRDPLLYNLNTIHTIISNKCAFKFYSSYIIFVDLFILQSFSLWFRGTDEDPKEPKIYLFNLNGSGFPS